MRASLFGLSVGLAAVGAGCSYDFAPVEEHYFTCDNDDECNSGYVCGGHTLVDRAPVSYCVEEGDARLGVVVAKNLAADCATAAVLHIVDMRIGTAETASAFDGVDSAPADAAQDCAGSVNESKFLDAICRVEAKDRAEIAVVGLWITIEDDASPPQGLVVYGQYPLAATDGPLITGLVEAVRCL